MRILVSVLLLLMFVPQWNGAAQLPLLGRVPRMHATRVQLDPADAHRKVGGLTFLGGIELTGPDAAFGGFSSLAIDGNRFTLLSDGGNIVRFDLDSRLRVSNPAFAELPDGPGAGWAKVDRDSESMTVDPATGQTWVGFETYNAIWRYDRDMQHAQGSVRPRVMRDWPENLGPESMVRLADGSFIVIAEDTPWKGGQGRAAIHFAGDPVLHPNRGYRWSYLRPHGYDVSDMTVLPDGRLLILNRTYDWRLRFYAKLVLIDPAQIHRGAKVRGQEIATLAPPLLTDNFEGVAVSQENGQTIVWIVSDDNQSILQRSLLYKFRLDLPPANAKSPDR